jgi:hypothetical protein
MTRILALAAAALALGACSAQQRFETAQGAARGECARLVDRSEYDRCMARASQTYDELQREEAARKARRDY